MKIIEILQDKEYQSLIQSFVNKGLKICIVLNNKEEIIAIYHADLFTPNDELNKKNFFIKGKNITDFVKINKSVNFIERQHYDLIGEISKIPTEYIGFSENLFSFVTIGIQGY